MKPGEIADAPSDFPPEKQRQEQPEQHVEQDIRDHEQDRVTEDDAQPPVLEQRAVVRGSGNRGGLRRSHFSRLTPSAPSMGPTTKIRNPAAVGSRKRYPQKASLRARLLMGSRRSSPPWLTDSPPASR